MAMENLQTQNIVAASSSSAEDDMVMIPIQRQPRPQQFHGNGESLRLYPPSPLLWAPVSRPLNYEHSIGALENTGHSSETIPKSTMCRVCDVDVDDNEEDADVLVELGCSCKGHLSRMHRKCILQWYGVRMLVWKNYKCELCKTFLHPETQLIVMRGVSDHEHGGRVILMNALKSAIPSQSHHHILDTAATYRELEQLLRSQERERPRENIIVTTDGLNVVDRTQSSCISRKVLISFAVVVIIGVALYSYSLHNYLGAGFH